MVKWLKNKEEESLNEYSRRIIGKYKIQKDDIVAGLSFGGIIAQEIARILNQSKVILISSFRDKSDLRYIYRIGLKSNLYKLAPSFRVPVIDEFVANYLNSENEESKPIIKQMLDETDYQLLKWSLEKIAEIPSNPNDEFIKYNIIGNNDMILKTWKNEYTSIIDGGSHFMVYEKSEEVTSTIREILN